MSATSISVKYPFKPCPCHEQWNLSKISWSVSNATILADDSSSRKVSYVTKLFPAIIHHSYDLCILTPSQERWNMQTIPAAKSTASTPVKKMPSKTPAPPMDMTSGLTAWYPGGERAGRTPGVIRLKMSAPSKVPMEPLMYARAGALP